jgi:hypothetical protein
VRGRASFANWANNTKGSWQMPAPPCACQEAYFFFAAFFFPFLAFFFAAIVQLL